MSNEANIELLKESLEALNAGDADRFMATIHDEVAMPDMNYDLQRIFNADDDNVIIQYVLRGTHEGEFMGIAPTHNKVEMYGCVISKIKDGKRYQMWQYASGPGLLDQLGAS